MWLSAKAVRRWSTRRTNAHRAKALHFLGSEVPKISGQESVEAVTNVFQDRIYGDFVLQRTVEQTVDESCVPRERVQQRTASAKLMILPKSWSDPLFHRHAVIEEITDSREREAEYNKKVAEQEWLDLMHFLRNRLTEIEEQLVLLLRS